MTLLSWLSNLLLLQIYIPISAFENGWNAPAWSIACEFFFYTAFPFFIFFITRWCKPRFSAFGTMTGMLIIGMLVFSVAVTCLFLMPPQFGRQGLFDYLVTRIPVVRIWEFFLGCSVGIAFLERQAAKEETGILSSWWGRSIGLVALGAILIGILLVPSPSLTPDMAPSLPTLITMAKVWVLCSPIFAGIIWLIASGSSIFSSILENRGLVLLGEASYSLYILHWLPFSALGVAETLGYSVSPLLATFVILGTIGVSIFGFRWIEVPARNILRPS
jgi:peptidoglycan/LPS O-acetylase OafA/YrhL